jgi:hypothetical protein
MYDLPLSTPSPGGWRAGLEALFEPLDDLAIQAAPSEVRRVQETQAKLLRHAKEKPIDPLPWATVAW